jgi:hypothetical protein
MRLFQGLLFLFFGVGLVVVAIRSLTSGWLPCGPNGFKGRLEFRRKDQPFRYWLMFAVYGVAGFWLAGYAVGILSGAVPPLPWA